MKQQRNATRACGHVLHTEPNLYMVVTYQPADGAPNHCRALCEFVDPAHPDHGDGLVVLLSPFDAYLTAALSSKAGTLYHAIHACEFDPRELIRDNGGAFHTFLHCAWGAHDGQLVTRRNGGLVSLYGLDTATIPPDETDAIVLRVAAEDLAAYDRMREQAGLFAHSEAHAMFAALDERGRHQAVARAMQRLPGTVDVSCDVNEMAIYDPEAAQWHFLPIDVFHQSAEAVGQRDAA
ncbi:MAG TPA: hypothetical protein VGD46_18715 [Rhizobacter sp.]